LDEWIDRDQIERLEELADRAGLDLGEYVRQALDKWIQKELGN
jgi:hypothetical protein